MELYEIYFYGWPMIALKCFLDRIQAPTFIAWPPRLSVSEQDSGKKATVADVMSLTNPFSYVPKVIFFTKGKGIHKDHLTSFELALREAQISDLNLVSVSSIKPPGCKIVSVAEGRKYLVPGQITFAVMARSSTNEPNRLIAASIGLARPADESHYGYLSEHHSTGETAQKAGDYAEDMAMEMLATTLGLSYDPSLTWDQTEEQWKLSGKIYRTQNFTQSAEGNKDGLWTTVLSTAILIL